MILSQNQTDYTAFFANYVLLDAKFNFVNLYLTIAQASFCSKPHYNSLKHKYYFHVVLNF